MTTTRNVRGESRYVTERVVKHGCYRASTNIMLPAVKLVKLNRLLLTVLGIASGISSSLSPLLGPIQLLFSLMFLPASLSYS